MSALITGLQTPGLLPQGFAMWISGVSYTPDTAATEAGKSLGLYQAVDTARTATKAAESARDLGEAGAKAFYRQAVDALKAQLGESNPQLAKYGVTPKKAPAVKTTQEKAQSAVKAKATRKARGTLGPKAKLAIKATNVPQVVVVDGAASESGSSTAPAATASATGSSTPASSSTPPATGSTVAPA